MNSKVQLHRFAQFLLVYTLLVILWGAWVRISHSGDGCGESWPLCHGQVIPDATQKKTWVEYGHRLTSGLFGLLVIYLFIKGRALSAPGTALRRALLATLIFMVTEALLGAKLVLLGLVGVNDSPLRLLAMGLHQVNSLLLSGSVALVAFYSSGLLENIPPSQLERTLRPLPRAAPAMLVFFVLVAITGAFASLSATLFPSVSIMEGIAKDFAADAHYLLRLRISHPILATMVGGILALYFWIKSQEEVPGIFRKATQQVALVFAMGIFVGYVTLFSLAPVALKVLHLLIAHVIWITLLRWLAFKSLIRWIPPGGEGNGSFR